MPVSRDTLMANVSSFKAKHLTKFSLDTTRIFLTCVSLITLKCGSHRETGISLLDSGSSLGYTTLQFAKKSQMKQDGVWQGIVQTIHGARESEHPIFVASIEDACGKVHSTKLLGTKKIGFKQGLPDALFKDLCSDLKVSSTSLQNPDGPIDILLGLDVSSLLASKHLELSSPRHPELFICSSPLYSQYFLCGAIGREMLSQDVIRTLTFKTDIVCFSISHYPAHYPDDSRDEGDHDPHDPCSPSPWHLGQFMSAPLKLLRSCSAIIRCHLSRWKQVTRVNKNISPQDNDGGSGVQPSYVIKSSPACDRLEDVMAIPSIHCQDCARRQAGCKVCKYLNSEISLNDLRELQLIRSLISVRPNPDDPSKMQIFCDYPWSVDINHAFAPKHSNMLAAKHNSERLRLRLLRINMAEAFHQEMQKVIELGHARLRTDFSIDLAPHNFIYINYVEKNSLSQSVRPVSNSGAKNKLGYDLNNATCSGPNFLQSGLQCLLSFRLLGGAGWSSDLSRAYRSVKTSSSVNDLRLFWWFKDVLDPASAAVYGFEVLNFGDRPASLILECALREHVSPAAKTPEVRHSIADSRLVDDFMGSLHTPDRLPIIREDLIKTTDHFGFKVKVNR